jgi:hypothetical protein
MTWFRPATLALILTGAMVAPPGAAAQQPEGLTASDNVRFVTNLPFEEIYPQSSRKSVDMDFTTTTVVTRPGKGKGRGGPSHRTERELAFVGTYMNGLQVVDITDPESPQVVAVYDCAIAQSDVDLFERPDLGRTFVTYTSDVIAGQTDFSSRCHQDNGVQPGQYGTFIVDVTDPLNPQSVSFIQFPRGTHQASVHPSGRWVYSSPASIGAQPGEFHVANVDDPRNPGDPRAVPLLTGLDSHDIIFSEDGTRGYVGALTHTLVMDTTDPADPQAIGRILDPSITIHHEAHPYTTVDELTGIEHTFLLVLDEFAGAAGNEVCPGGGIHIFDITGHLERAPVKVGAYFAPQVGPVEGAGQGAAGLDRCSAHVLQIHPDQEIATVSWYALGTRVLDLSGLVGLSAGVTEESGSQGTGIREVAYAHFDDGDVWATKTNRIEEDGTFYVYAADTARMLDVFHVDLSAEPSTGSPAPAGGGFSSDNVEWLGAMPAHTGTSGGKLVGDHYYLTDPRGVFIYDASDPASPQLVGSLLAAQSSTHVVFAQEEPDTNGEILLVNGFNPEGEGQPSSNGWLLVVDVSDPTSPSVIGSLNVYDHTWTCVLDCTYAIGRTGHIIDLTDPTQPRNVANWRAHIDGDNYMHDFTEVAPGKVLGAGQPSYYLDLTDPVNPVELARIESNFHTLGYHGSAWPNGGTDPILLMGAEAAPQGAMNTAGSDCTDQGVHAVATYDATPVTTDDGRSTFQKLHEWRVEGRGVYADGNAPFHTLFCGHWFDPHPRWEGGGVLAMAHYDWGTRFLDVAEDGSMEEIGWFQPVQGYTGSAKWITDEIVYVHDYRRGLEVLRFTGAPA